MAAKESLQSCYNKWLLYTDAQIKSTTSLNGWQFFVWCEDDPKWSKRGWRKWNFIAVCLDQGSMDFFATFSLEYHFKVCLVKWPDFFHGGHKDLQVALKDIGWWDWLLLFMINANVNHGPSKDDQRHHQVRDSMRAA